MDSEPVLARKVYTRLAERLVEHGTGAVLLFGTIKTQTKCVAPNHPIRGQDTDSLIVQPHPCKMYDGRGPKSLHRQTVHGQVVTTNIHGAIG